MVLYAAINGRTISNSGKMKSTTDGSAPASMKKMTRFPDVIRSPRVGHADCVMGTWGGTYIRSVIPELSSQIIPYHGRRRVNELELNQEQTRIVESRFPLISQG